ncbi:antennal-specific protein OS-C isoform X1 [Drosophila willistoni]|uniref:antennal-specific protein OS-C isoform X1 n=1 Tax=Drosophila willistoni TaxID=7260 RepID=UPI000C26C9D2|nr:antennal-specific protein OS-C isoform X1 [Drosophila willistoni]
MAFQRGPHLLLATFCLLLCQLVSIDQAQAKPQDLITVVELGSADEVIVKPKGDDDEDSSSEETVEDSAEDPQRRRRDTAQRASIPGLPDPATIIKIAELFQSVGEQIVPILLEAILPGTDAAGDRIARNVELLKSFKRSLEVYSTELQMDDM